MKKKFLLIIVFIFSIISIFNVRLNAYTGIDENKNYKAIYTFDQITIQTNANNYILNDNITYSSTPNNNISNTFNKIYFSNSSYIQLDYSLVSMANYTNCLRTKYNQPYYISESSDINRMIFEVDQIIINTELEQYRFQNTGIMEVAISFYVVDPITYMTTKYQRTVDLQGFDLTTEIFVIYGDDTKALKLKDLRVDMRKKEYQTFNLTTTQRGVRTNATQNDYLIQWLADSGLLEKEINFTGFILSIFQSFAAIMSIQLGGISLGAILLIPAILSMVFVIIRIWRGGSA